MRKDGRTEEEHELILFIDNDEWMYRQKDAFLANVHRKIKSGKYSPALAHKLWIYYVDRGAKKYAEEFGGTWNKMFPKPARDKAAAHYAIREVELIQEGAYSKYPPIALRGQR